MMDRETDARPSVLVVDDEEVVACVLARGLARAGYPVSIALSGAEALRLLDSGSFSLLLTDIHMPEMRGDELQRLARQKDPDLAVLLVTAVQDVACAVECLTEGAYDYLIKPFKLSDIVVRVQKALERRSLTLENRSYQANLERRVQEQAERLRKMLQYSLATLIEALEAKDENTRNHSTRVADLATALAGRLGCEDANWIARLRVAALFHDIGKIGVPEAILNKPGRLTESEMAEICRHPVIGEAILRPLLDGDTDMLSIIRGHHEQWNGNGYPDGLVGEETPLGARIVAVADAYDAMTSARPYRSGMPRSRALQILREGAGAQWDPAVVTAFLEILEAGGLDTILAPDTLEAILSRSVENSPALDDSRAPEGAGGHGSASAMWHRRPVLHLQRHLDEAAGHRLQSEVGATLGRGKNDFILDMRQIGFLDPASVQTIHLLHLRVQEAGGQMTIRDAPDHALAAFREAGLYQTLCFEQSPIRRPRHPSHGAGEKHGG